MTVATRPDLARAEQAVGSVVDPEIPALTIADLGIVRGVEVEDRRATVTITPTYSGCPAMNAIRADIERALGDAGFSEVEVRTVYWPAWSTDWMSERGRRRLEESGIAPPGDWEGVRCPRCDAGAPRTVSEFGSTACKALLVCGTCGEPFDFFKRL